MFAEIGISVAGTYYNKGIVDSLDEKNLEVIDFHNFLYRSHIILTDSGGLQEEAPSLGKPILVMRDTTELPEGVSAGTLELAGTNEETIYESFKLLLENQEKHNAMSKTSNHYGDGYASKRIVDILTGGKKLLNL